MTAAKPRRYRCLPRQAIEAGLFALRPVEPADVELIRHWRNAQLDVLRQAKPISSEEQEAYFETTVWPDFDSDRPRNILLTFLEEGRPIGYGGFVHIAWEHARAEISFLLEPEIARDPKLYHARFEVFLHLIRTVAFDDLGLHRLFTETYAFRSEHIATLDRCGFVREGTLRHHVVVRGEPTDSIVQGCLSS